MTDYHPLIARAVEGLAKNTGDARRALYERARAALVAQLRSVEPALSESDITKERLALEEAIRKVEGEAARKALAEPHTSPRTEPRFEARPTQPRRAAAGAGPLTSSELFPAPRRERSNTVAAELSSAGRGEPRQIEPRQLESFKALSKRVEARQMEQPQSVPDASEAAVPAEMPPPASKPTARSRILQARTSSLKDEGLKGFRNVVNEVDGASAATAKTPRTARDLRDAYGPTSRQRTAQAEDLDPPSRPAADAPYDGGEEIPQAEEHALRLQSLGPAYDDFEDEQPARSYAPRPAEFEEAEQEYEEPRPPRSYRGWAKAALFLIVVLGVAATGWTYRSNIAGVYHFVSQIKSRPAPQPSATPAPDTKFTGRVPQDQVPGQAPAVVPSSNSEQRPEVAQRAVLYEADPNDPQGKRFPGSVVWRTETVSPGAGMAPELAVRADISIPERHMTVTWSLRRNTDKALPASHTIEIMFNLPPDFPGGGISNVPGILMKDSEAVRGMPLAGLAVKVTNGFFLIGLNAANEDVQRNMQLLKGRSWFDILLVYNNGSRAILTMEKGPPGDRAFSEAFKAWGQ